MTSLDQPRGVIAWFASNSVAANLLMLGIIVLGLLTLPNLRKETIPSRPADTVSISVSYQSGDPVLSEEGIAIKIEEALASVQGIKRITSTSTKDGASVSVEMVAGYDLDTLLVDVKAKVDAIYSFPSDAEKPVIAKDQRISHAYSVKLVGGDDHKTLQTLAQKLKAEFLASSDITNVSINGEVDVLLSIELDEAALQAYGLSLSDVSAVINAESSTALSSSLRNGDKTYALKVSQQAYYQQDFASLTLLSLTTGGTVKLGDVALISDTFADDAFVLSRYNGQTGIGLELKVDAETGDVIKIVEQVDTIVARWKQSNILPKNISLETWYDGSELIRDRLAMLIKNALSGIALVFLVLALFLNLRVALWVTAGLPFIFCGTLFFMTDSITGMTINEMSTFGFILALGIVVDDAIVVGESIYSERSKNGDTLANTIIGTQKVAVPTIFGVFTTVATFIALSNVSGGMGHVYSQFAVIVTICLLLSIVESKLILPAHLAHLNTRRQTHIGIKHYWGLLQRACDSGLNYLNHRIYTPALNWVINYRYSALLLFITLFIFIVGMPLNGTVRVGFFPKIPGSVVSVCLSMQKDASVGLTHKALLQLEQQAYTIDRRLSQAAGNDKSSIATLEVIASDDTSASITVELTPTASYSIDEFAGQWKQLAGTPEGVRKLNIRSGFGGGNDFRVELKSWDSGSLKQVGLEFREALENINGVQGIDDNFHSGRAQLSFSLTEQGRALGVSSSALSKQILQAFGGDTVQRYQRGKNEVKVRLRYPLTQRKTIEDVLNSHIQLADGSFAALSSIAKLEQGYQQNSITRINALPAIYVSASVDKDVISSNELVSQLQQELVPRLKAAYPELGIHFAGEAEQQAETSDSMSKLFLIALLAIYILLAVPLKSYVQPLIIMSVIPFGLVGAILGHWANDIMLSVLSFNGMVALSGVVVNDSLLLVSGMNQNLRQGHDIKAAVLDTCAQRFRPVLLTSITTYAGLVPLLGETSSQAQFIIPAAASLGYGILFATVITLLLIPVLMMIQQDVVNMFNKIKAA